MLYFALAKLMQVRLPPRIMFKVFRDMFGEQNVTGVPAIHYALRDVDSRGRDIRLLV